MSWWKSKRMRAMTVLELLTAISIVGVMIALLLPAVQAARETARRMTCTSHLRQLVMGAHAHHDAIQHYPSGGWGYRWVGDPDRGVTSAQPGGWIYNTLPYVEQANVRDIGRGGDTSAKRAALAEMCRVPLRLFYCPTRRKSGLYPFVAHNRFVNADSPATCAKSDYAGNGGDWRIDHKMGGPASDDGSVIQMYPWPPLTNATGVFYLRSMARAAEISDGLSNVYFVGEKCMATRPYDRSTRDDGDDQTLFIGDDRDIRRWTDIALSPDSRAVSSLAFGSAHSNACAFAFGDGSVRHVSFSIAPAVHRQLGNRQDGAP